MVSVVSIEDTQTSKSDKQLKKAIDRVLDSLVQGAKAAGQAALLHLVKTVVYIASTANAKNPSSVSRQPDISQCAPVLLKLQVRNLANLTRQPTLEICKTVYDQQLESNLESQVVE